MVDIHFKDTAPAWVSFYSTTGKVIFETEQIGTGIKQVWTFTKKFIETMKRSA